jgi:hypothetical protein
MTRRLVILVTGSREFAKPELIGEGRRLIGNALAQAVRDAVADEVVIRHGACRGADMIADEWARAMQRLGRKVEIDARPGDWKRYGRAAGFIRNGEMVAEGADICLAFPYGMSPGTRDCIARAQAAGIPVRIYERQEGAA